MKRFAIGILCLVVVVGALAGGWWWQQQTAAPRPSTTQVVPASQVVLLPSPTGPIFPSPTIDDRQFRERGFEVSDRLLGVYSYPISLTQVAPADLIKLDCDQVVTAQPDGTFATKFEGRVLPVADSVTHQVLAAIEVQTQQSPTLLKLCQTESGGQVVLYQLPQNPNLAVGSWRDSTFIAQAEVKGISQAASACLQVLQYTSNRQLSLICQTKNQNQEQLQIVSVDLPSNQTTILVSCQKTPSTQAGGADQVNCQ